MVETQFTANTGMVSISTANTNLDGTGAMGLVLTAAASGTLIKSVIIKAIVTTNVGMVRFFIKNVSNNNVNILTEIYIPKIAKTSRDCSYQNIIPINYEMLAGDMLYAATEKSDTFNIIAEGLNWSYGSTVREDATHYVAKTGSEKISTANSNLDGTGTIVQIIQAGSSATYKGCEISSIKIKAQQSTSPGIVRFYLKNGANAAVLFSEVVIPQQWQDSTIPSFEYEVIKQGSFAIQADFYIYASTQVAENFSITVFGSDWLYP